jgi:hypothetical protein
LEGHGKLPASDFCKQGRVLLPAEYINKQIDYINKSTDCINKQIGYINKPTDYINMSNSKFMGEPLTGLEVHDGLLNQTGKMSPSAMLNSDYDIPVWMSANSLDKIGSLQTPQPIGRPCLPLPQKKGDPLVDCASDPLIEDLLRKLDDMNWKL